MRLRNFRVCNYIVHSAKVSTEQTFVFLSDLHSVVYGDGTDPDGPNGEIVRAIDGIRPDAVLIGGDMIVARDARIEENGWMEVPLDLMRRLARKYPVYLADGNHEAQLANPSLKGRFLPAYERYYEAVRAAGGVRLHNQYVEISRDDLDLDEIRVSDVINPETHHAAIGTANSTINSSVCNTEADGQREQVNAGVRVIRLYGLDLDGITYEKWMNYPLQVHEIEEKIGKADPSCFNIVMAHNPKYFPVYAEWGADLVLSGHIHGGILRFPGGQGLLSPDWKLFPPYTAGEYHIKSVNEKGKEGLNAGKPQNEKDKTGPNTVISVNEKDGEGLNAGGSPIEKDGSGSNIGTSNERSTGREPGDSVMILTAGIGTHTVPIRINNPPDICRITVAPEG